MRKELDIKGIKRTFKTLLYLPLEKNKDFDFIIHHPFTDCNFFNSKEGLKEIDSNIEEWYSVMLDLIDKCDVGYLFAILNKPYRLTVFKYINEYLDKEHYIDFLTTAFKITEFPNYDKNVSVSQLERYFKKVDVLDFIKANDSEDMYNELDDTFIVYRGYYGTDIYNALSWTTDIEIAKKFSKRFSNEGVVVKAIASKDKILGCLLSESEIIVHNKTLKDITVIDV